MTICASKFQKNTLYELKTPFFSKDTVFLETLTKSNVDTTTVNGWMRGELNFFDEPFSYLIKSIERKHGVAITINNELLKNKTFKGQYVKPSLDTLLDDIAFIPNFSYRRKGNQSS
ncbi:MAG: DUF4974 domain-containing protein [Bacteroidota bacterium]